MTDLLQLLSVVLLTTTIVPTIDILLETRMQHAQSGPKLWGTPVLSHEEEEEEDAGKHTGGRAASPLRRAEERWGSRKEDFDSQSGMA